MVQVYAEQHGPERIIAYTRNPMLLRLLGNTSRKLDVLDYSSPHELALTIPHAEVGDDGIIYHIDRYAPEGLYGTFDPADLPYNGEVLKERCQLLENRNTALAVSVMPRIAHTL